LQTTGRKMEIQGKQSDDGRPLKDIDSIAVNEAEKMGADPIQEIEKKLELKEQEVKEIYDRLLRATAEFENYKKRARRESDDFKKYANESLIAALLPVVDNLQRAISSFKENDCHKATLAEGVSLTLAEILKVLEKFNVTAIESLGQPFDPNFHEAMMQESSDAHVDNTVIRELQKGYRIHDRLLRPSLVVVSKNK
jgi:molecular chaperone GrpE